MFSADVKLENPCSSMLQLDCSTWSLSRFEVHMLASCHIAPHREILVTSQIIESLVEGTYHCGSSDQTPLVTECAPIILKKSHKIIIAPSPDDVFFQISIQDQLALANMSWNFPGCSMSNYSGYNQDFASVNSATVRIVEEPRSIGLRFRYPSEGRGAGVLQARDFFKMQLPLTIFNEIQLNHVSLSH